MGNKITTNINELLALARDRSTEGRTALVSAVSDVYFGADRMMTDHEQALMSDILHRLVNDIEMTVRKSLAERLADQPNAPHDLIITLANDEIPVAGPILARSDVLLDSDLIEIIRHRTSEHRLAITMRRALNEEVCDALVQPGEANVITKLLENSNARISSATMAYLVEESQRVNEYQEPIIKRADLPQELAMRMYWWVSAALRKHILDNFEIDRSQLDASIEATVKSIAGARDPNDGFISQQAIELSERLARIKAITPQFIIQVLRNGEIPLFHALLVKFTGLRAPLLCKILYEPGGESLAVISRACGIEKADFASLFLLSRRLRPGDMVIDAGELAEALRLFERLDHETAERIMDRWRRDPQFVDAMNRIDRSERIVINS